ncbi:acyl carrier protein [Runella sp. MFBS21]|uniref:acyl carrier protein n=1 Tax=Runella sp. MFBS21 TaxID=3034018 RepID=UPI0023F61FE9|nr:acyl carrier protein [Runella sp. MFBS21]MCA0233122.1 acyl carrier protein [Bacteroidota bacterium]MDF7821246.1 acyl carrier protein [Runella sp. MFBS21]
MNPNPFSQIQTYLTKSFFVPKKAIVSDLLFRRLAFSSAEFMEIVFLLETQNQITLPDADLQQVKTVGDLVLLTEQWLKNATVTNY